MFLLLLWIYFCLFYDNFVIMGDFNVAMSDNAMEGFCTLKNFESLIKKQTCYKNQTNLSCLDLALTNRDSYFQHSNVFETGMAFIFEVPHSLKWVFLKATKICTITRLQRNGNIKFCDGANNFAFG